MNLLQVPDRNAIYKPLADQAWLALQNLLSDPDDARVRCLASDQCDDHPEFSFRKWMIITTIVASLNAGLVEDDVLDGLAPCDCSS